MHMTDLFDMIAGTSIGSISASAMSIGGYDGNPKEPKYFAEDLITIMTTQAHVLFQQSHVGYWKQFFGYIFFIIFFSVSFHLLGKNKYKNTKLMKS